MNRSLLFVVASLTLSAPALAGECSIAVLNLQGVGLPEDQAHIPKILTDTIATEVDKLASECRVITQADIAQMLDYEAQKAACGGDSVSCLSDIGGALGVGFVIGGTVGKLGSSFSLQARYIDINSAEVLRRVEVDVDGEVVQLRAAAKKLAAELLGKEPSVEVEGTKAGEPASGGGLFWTGVALVSVGALVAVGGGALSAANEGILADPSASRGEKDDALFYGPTLFVAALAGAAVAVAGGVLIGVGAME